MLQIWNTSFGQNGVRRRYFSNVLFRVTQIYFHKTGGCSDRYLVKSNNCIFMLIKKDALKIYILVFFVWTIELCVTGC